MNNRNIHIDLLTSAHVGRTLTSMMVPVLLGILSVMLFNLIDTIFAARLGVDALAAISFTFPVVAFVTALMTAITVSTVAIVSTALGAKKHDHAQALSRDVMLLGLFFFTCCMIVGLFTIKPLFISLGARAELLPLISSYMTVWYPGMVLLTLLTITNGLMRACGDMRTPTYLMVFSVSLNAILDPIFMFGFTFIPALGLQGAAWAGLLARGLTLIIALKVLQNRKNIISLMMPKLKNLWENWLSVLSMAIPVAITNLFFPIATSIITVMLARYGDNAVAAFGAGSRIEGLALFVPIAMCSALSPFIGINAGAGNTQRIKEALIFAQRFVVIWGLLIWMLGILLGHYIAALFTNDPHVSNMITSYLSIALAGLALQGIASISISAFNTLKKPILATAFNAIRLIAILIPSVYFFASSWGITGAWIGLATAHILAGTLAYISLKWYLTLRSEDLTK